MQSEKVVLGMDMGGTNLRLGVVDSAGNVRNMINRLLGPDKSPKAVTGEIVRRIEELRHWCEDEGLAVEAVCLSAPGIISREEGIIAFSPNLPGWKNVPLRGTITRETGLRASLENDANAAAFGEYWKGGGEGARHLVMFTLGTGVGGGVISDGRLIRGERGMGGELGHITVSTRDPRPCKCGNRGCLEVYASATAITERIAERWTESSPPPPTAREAYLLARAGDPLCLEVFREAGDFLGIAMADMVNIVNPQVIIIGGGVTEAWDFFIPAAEAEMRDRSFRFTDLAKRVDVRRAVLGELAGVVGAAGIYWSEAPA